MRLMRSNLTDDVVLHGDGEHIRVQPGTVVDFDHKFRRGTVESYLGHLAAAFSPVSGRKEPSAEELATSVPSETLPLSIDVGQTAEAVAAKAADVLDVPAADAKNAIAAVADRATVDALRAYEKAHKQRVSVLDALDKRAAELTAGEKK